MPDVRTPCPTAKQLRDYGQGKLSVPDLSVIHEHLTNCAPCRQKVVDQPPDSFIDQLRASAPQGSNTVLPRRAPLPATTLDDLPPELAGSSKFEMLEKLGEGGMGAVYKARHAFLNELVAIKVMNATTLSNPDARSRFLREMQAVGQLKHKNIVRALDAEQIGELLVLVMEYVEGVTLDRLVAQKGTLPVVYSCDCIARASRGLQYAHDKNMVHRDVKPANLIVATKEKEVKLLDFGLARGTCAQKTKDNRTQIGVPMGTPAFMAPEQVTDASSVDIRADVYSLGCTLYFLMAGQSPFQRDSAMTTMMAQVSDEARPLLEVRSDVPAELWTVMAKMLAKKPEDRYQTPKEVEQSLRPFIAGGAKAVQAVGGKAKAEMHAAATMLPGNTSMLKPVPSPSRMPPAAAPVEKASPFDASVAVPVASPVSSTAKKRKRKARSAPVAWWRRLPVLAGVGAAVLALVVVAGVIIKIKMNTPKGDVTVLLEIDQPGAQVLETAKVADEKLKDKPAPKRVPEDKLKDKPAPKSDGYVKLFNGEDLKGWVVDSGDENAWQVKDGELVARGAETDDVDAWRNQGYLLAQRGYSDFVLRFQFQQARKHDVSGVAVRAVRHETAVKTDSSYTGERDIPYHLTVVVGLRDPVNPIPAFSGSLWWTMGAKPCLAPDNLAALKKVGEWNDMEVEMRGQSLRIAVNGRDVLNVMLNKTSLPTNPAPGLSRYSGRIGFLKRVGEVRYRKIEIKDLSKADAK